MTLVHIGRVLVGTGLLLLVAGGVLLVAGKLGVGRVPGDLMWRGETWAVYVPLGSMILLSVLLTLLINFFLRR